MTEVSLCRQDSGPSPTLSHSSAPGKHVLEVIGQQGAGPQLPTFTGSMPVLDGAGALQPDQGQGPYRTRLGKAADTRRQTHGSRRGPSALQCRRLTPGLPLWLEVQRGEALA